MDDEIIWNIIDKYFKDNPTALVSHHLESYNDFFNNGIKRIFKEKNPIKIMKDQDERTKEFNLRCNLYLGGKNGDKLYFGKPIIYDENREHFMYPNEARLRNMTYGTTIHYDVEVDFFIKNGEETIQNTMTIERMYLGKFPIMLNSDLCILKGLTPLVKFNMGECKNDVGGYFIIDGSEKVILPQEKFADNMIYIREDVDDLYSHSIDIRSVSDDASKPMRTVSVKIVRPSPSMKNGQIVVNIPNVKKPMPLFIVMRALGIESDKDIIKYCLLDMDKYSSYIDLFIPSIHDAGRIFTQEMAIKYISTFTKVKTVSGTLHILMDYFLPHIGELNFQMKAYFLGYMTLQMLKVYTKEKPPTDRDSFRYKRLELSGMLMYDLFKEYFTLQQSNIFLKIDRMFYYNQDRYRDDFKSLIELNYNEFFADRVVEEGFRKAFKGNWGSEEHTKRLGVVQPLNRLSYNGFIGHLRKLNLEMDSSAKVVAPRKLHGSQWGIIDPIDSPDGGNIGLQKHLAIMTKVTSGCSGKPIVTWLRNYANMSFLEEHNPIYLSKNTKVFVNGVWCGTVSNPKEVLQMLKQYRRSALIPIFTSLSWNIEANELIIYTDAGRLCRPIFYIDETSKNPSYNKQSVLEKLKSNNYKWDDLIAGFASKKESAKFKIENCNYYNVPSDLYNTSSFTQLSESQSILEYLDTSEAETALIALDEGSSKDKEYTHIEIHPSLILGALSNLVVFPEHNPIARNNFGCGQSRQSISLYNSNYQSRIDKMGVVLNNGQIPIVKSRYLKYINNEEHPYGENVIVAIGVYGSYNVEDSILFNEAAIKRGMFRMTYYTSYESREESSKVGTTSVDSKIANIEKSNAIGLKPGYDYSKLDEHGLIKENTPLDDSIVLIGKILTNPANPDTPIDASEMPKKGQLGFVDKSFITDGEEGFRTAKVRIREERPPNIGDKFSSRCGQKGTVGLIIPEQDMPFTAEGIRPDIIINPHALPTRMTIGQLVETIMGKACALYGGFGDCTAFVNKGLKYESFGRLLTNIGLSKTGKELLYNGQTGEQMETDIFIGPTYYMRLKHMVKDKVNYRARGPRTALTRQTVQGRANDGGLRIGEMERDGIIAHGASHFLEESLMIRGDEYYMAVCNQTGSIAVYNKAQNLFLSPMSDGPIQFDNITKTSANIVNMSKFGKDFSIVRVPYAFKLLMQELKTMNIEMRIITEDNIDQLTNLSFSENYKKLSGDFKSEISKIIQKDLDKSGYVKKGMRKQYQEQEEEKSETKIEGPDLFTEIDLQARKFGWKYIGEDVEGDFDYIFNSLIIDELGNPTDIKYIPSVRRDVQAPNDFPRGWKYEQDYFMYDSDSRIAFATKEEVINELYNTQTANNWQIVLTKMRIQKGLDSPESESPKFYVNTPPSGEESPKFYVNTPPEPQTPSGTPPSFQPQTPSGTPPPFQPQTPSGTPPSFQPQTPSGTPPPFQPQTPSGTPPSSNSYKPISSEEYEAQKGGNKPGHLIKIVGGDENIGLEVIPINSGDFVAVDARRPSSNLGSEQENKDSEEMTRIQKLREKSQESILIPENEDIKTEESETNSSETSQKKIIL
jgi:DNA-directed RNA polymerase II subunit RPB2